MKTEDRTITVKKRGGGERTIPAHRWFINRNTPVGEDADFYEIKPYDGRRYIPYDTILRIGDKPFHY